ncbi:hypothetical protein CYMTET_6359 [Cymbomonas tetramitiformis]|uniref:Right handed beta helix domain-containing protein n=1 Tax=Cymbomonas tetramitiformis TaxID=36881 RepID=A0AAE0GXS7_9CHLO|nr:hypothetical protein CYMTET_6359 [Cymbomonas tetramitiformis]
MESDSENSTSTLRDVIGFAPRLFDWRAGGGIYCMQKGTVVEFHGQGALTSNQAEQGAAIYIASECSVTFHGGAQINGNVALKEGGGIYLQSAADASLQGPAELIATNIDIFSNEVVQYSGGGINCGKRSKILMTDVRLWSNQAPSGGGLYASGCEVRMEKTSLRANLATDGTGSATLIREGAFVLLDETQVQDHGWDAEFEQTATIEVQDSTLAIAHNSQIVRNRMSASTDSHVIKISKINEGSSVNISHSLVAENEGAASVYVTDSRLDISDTVFSGNRGSSLHCDAEAHVQVSRCNFTNNTYRNNDNPTTTDEIGAGVRSEVQSHLQVVGCLFQENLATRGSSMFIRGSLAADGCVFRQNRATAGTLYAELTANHSVAISSSSFVANVVTNGAGLYLKSLIPESDMDGEGPDAASLTHLLFEQNRATGGGWIGFWEPSDLHTPNPSQPPECVQCSMVNNTAAYNSSLGWATAVTAIRAKGDYGEVPGGTQLSEQSAIRVMLVDMYGQAVTTAGGDPVTMTTDCNTRNLNDAQVQNDGIAEYEGLVVSESPLTNCSLNFSLGEQSNVPIATSVVSIRECYEGEFYRAADTKCIICGVDQLAFGDSIEACVDCNEYDGIVCNGGSKYTILVRWRS